MGEEILLSMMHSLEYGARNYCSGELVIFQE